MEAASVEAGILCCAAKVPLLIFRLNELAVERPFGTKFMDIRLKKEIEHDLCPIRHTVRGRRRVARI